MKLMKISFGLLILLLFNNVSATEYAQVFNKSQLIAMKQQYLGKQWMILLWSVDCPPCFKELALVQKLANQHKNLPIIIINVDADTYDKEELSAERNNIIEQFGLQALSHYYFEEGMAAQSRFLIDSTWYGELPRSYFVESNGQFHGKSGLVNETLLKHWLLGEKPE